MQGWQIALLIFLAVVLVLGMTAALGERRGWIKSPKVRRVLRRIYGLDRDDPDRDDEP